jgi:hypothetical protein
VVIVWSWGPSVYFMYLLELLLDRFDLVSQGEVVQSFTKPVSIQIGQVKPGSGASSFGLLPVYIWSIYLYILYYMVLSPLDHQDL